MRKFVPHLRFFCIFDYSNEQRKECERLEDEMRFLKKTMLERVQFSEGVTLLRSTQGNAPPFSNVRL